MHPIYKWGQSVDLRVDVEAIQKLNYEDLKKEMKKSPKVFKNYKIKQSTNNFRSKLWYEKLRTL